MKTMISALAISTAMIASPAAAQIGIDLGADVDLGTDIDLRVGEPYEYRAEVNGQTRTYSSGRWYPYEEPRREYVYYDRYGGYDCYRAFYYTWEDRHRARYDSYWCYDDDGRRYEVDDTRVVVRID